MTSYSHAARAALVLFALSAPFASSANADNATASVRGELERISLGNTGTYIYGLDGRMIHPSPPMYENPIALTPGPHSLLIGFNASKYAWLPARIDAKADARYVVRFEQAGRVRDELINTVWIEDEATREIIVPKRQIWPEVVPAVTYAPPASGATGTIHGTAAEDKAGASYLRAVDGISTNIADAGRTAPLALATGPRALLISFASDRIVANLPVLIDVKPGARYVIGYTIDDQRFSSQAAPIFKFWVEDEATHERVVPETKVPVRVLKYSMDTKPALGRRK